jgi:RNA polymerase-binding transcription factor
VPGLVILSRVVVGDVTATENVPGDLAHFREILMKRRQEILDNQKPLADSMIDTNTRQGDLADQANGNNEVHIHLKLKQTDAKILIAIEEALQRVEAGSYGVCRDCGDEISKARLEAIPWTRVCISCKEKQKA